MADFSMAKATTDSNDDSAFEDSISDPQPPLVNGYHKSKGKGGGDEDDSDPEVQAEMDVAKENGLDMATIKARLRKAKLFDPEPPKVLNGVVHVPRSQKNQRKSRNGRGRGEAKKGGSGGKGVWGAPGKVYEEPEFLDSDDPNYDSDVQANVKYAVISPEQSEEEIAKNVEGIILEFYGNGIVLDAVDLVEELNLARNARPFLVRLMVTLAMDHKSSHRELTSQLLSELVSKRVFTQIDIARAFDRLLNSDLPDLVIDCPAASEIMGNFIARAIADEILPQKFVDVDKEAAANPHATEALERAEIMLQQKHRLDDVWGVGTGRRPVRYLVKKMKLLLDEYLSSGDLTEAVRCLRELEVPHFHHELVFQAGVIIVEAMHARPVRLLTELLGNLFDTGFLTPCDIRAGFERLYAALPDLSLDVPPAYTLMETWVEACRKQGFLPEVIARKMPQRGRKRFVSEGDGGRFKVIDVSHPLI